MSKFVTRSGLIGIVFMIGVISSHGQELLSGCAGIRGRVTDRTGALLPGATIVIENSETGFRREQLTRTDGEYVVCLPRGSYRVAARLPGFAPLMRESIVEEPTESLTVESVESLRRTVDFVLDVVPFGPGRGVESSDP